MDQAEGFYSGLDDSVALRTEGLCGVDTAVCEVINSEFSHLHKGRKPFKSHTTG